MYPDFFDGTVGAQVEEAAAKDRVSLQDAISEANTKCDDLKAQMVRRRC